MHIVVQLVSFYLNVHGPISSLDLFGNNKLNTYTGYDKVLNIGETSYRKCSFFLKVCFAQGYLANLYITLNPRNCA